MPRRINYSRVNQPRRRSRRQLRGREEDGHGQNEVEMSGGHGDRVPDIPPEAKVQDGDEEHDPDLNGGHHPGEQPRRRSRRRLRGRQEDDNVQENEVEMRGGHGDRVPDIPPEAEVQDGDEEHDPDFNGGQHPGEQPRRRSRRRFRRRRGVDNEENNNGVEMRGPPGRQHGDRVPEIPLEAQVQDGDEVHDPDVNGGVHPGEEQRGFGLVNGVAQQDGMQHENPLAGGVHHINPGEGEENLIDTDPNWYADYSGSTREPDFEPIRVNRDEIHRTRLDTDGFLQLLRRQLQHEFTSNDSMAVNDIMRTLMQRQAENGAVEEMKEEIGGPGGEFN